MGETKREKGQLVEDFRRFLQIWSLICKVSGLEPEKTAGNRSKSQEAVSTPFSRLVSPIGRCPRNGPKVWRKLPEFWAERKAQNPDTSLAVTVVFRLEKLQNESSPNFSKFCPEFCPEFCSEFSPNFLRSFRASFRGKRRPEKFTKNPRHFSMQNSQASSKKKSTKVLWRTGKVSFSGPDLDRLDFLLFEPQGGLRLLCQAGGIASPEIHWRDEQTPCVMTLKGALTMKCTL